MTIFNRVILAILMWATLGAGTTLASIVQPLVNTDWVANNLDNKKVVLIDLRNKIDEGSYETYLDGHIPSSIHSDYLKDCLLYTSPSPRDATLSRMPSSA